jgi:hypothetical protein
LNYINGMCFDTTSSNTGIHEGACTHLENKIKKELYYFACRHHIHELLVSAAFNTLFEVSSGPNIKLFQRLKSSWNSIDQERYESAIVDKKICNIIIPIKVSTEKFIKEQLQKNHAREDYIELLQLSLLFLGENLEKKIKFRSPGAVHRARWLAKLIYCLKMYLFREQLKLTHRELSSLQQFNTFVVKVYLKYWYQCECVIYAHSMIFSY